MITFLKSKLIVSLIYFGLLLMIKPGLAVTEIEIEDDKTFKNKITTAGDIKVSISYAPIDLNQTDTPNYQNLQYKIYYQNRLRVEGGEVTFYTGNVSLQDLDNNGKAEVIIKTYSGGAHCCTNHIIYSWKNQQFVKTQTGMLNAGGGIFKDINGDGNFEFLTDDNAFLYTFSSYAGSFPPSLIYRLQNGKLIDVTRQFPQALKARLQQMHEAFLQTQKEEQEVNGILAGYVAQKILLGQYQQGWEFMLKNYDHQSDWGLEIYEGERKVGQYPDFPTALKAFLIQTGYLNSMNNVINNH